MDKLGFNKKRFSLIYNGLIAIAIYAVVGIIFFLGALYEHKTNKEIKSNQRIKPDFKITIEKDKTDTLFIYKLKK